jgi:hypothetical protein
MIDGQTDQAALELMEIYAEDFWSGHTNTSVHDRAGSSLRTLCEEFLLGNREGLTVETHIGVGRTPYWTIRDLDGQKWTGSVSEYSSTDNQDFWDFS